MSNAVPPDAHGGASAASAAESSSSTVAQNAGDASALTELLGSADLSARRFDIAAGAAIYETATPARNLYLIQNGQVRILLPTASEKQRMVRLLEILGPGDWFGAPALSGGLTYDTRALAVTKVTLAEIPADRLLAA